MGLIHIYCGNGKGKTTAAMGLAIRGAGNGMRVHIVQLLKGKESSEIKIMKNIPGITIKFCNKDYGFTFNLDENSRNELIECHNSLLSEAEELMKSNKIDILIIDEFNNAYKKNLLNKDIADRIIFEKTESVELVLTGRDPQEKFIEVADYVSEIIDKKHPFKQGVPARAGIEY